ncbi:MAG: DUF2975 domain-containing protein [Clostridiales bacterium]|nr:DUF2975 domain-containing protein [Clostridiales bacterium]
MEMDAEKLARILKRLVSITFVCNLLVLPLLAGLARLKGMGELTGGISCFFEQGEGVGQILLRLVGYFLTSWGEIWLFEERYAQVLALFLFFCGVCTAVILWQGRRVLDTVLRGETFTRGNAANMGRAAVCCFLISGAALLRTVWGLFHDGSIGPLFTYNTLFIPVFFMAGLLCLILSALVRQAAELKEENDLTI